MELFTRELGAVPFNPTCVWNQAYNENFDADTYDAILEGARDCYTLVDPFDGEMKYDTANKISKLKSNGNSVGCYISSGSCEDWRDDFDDIQQYCVNKQWGDWAGEYFVFDIDGIFPYMKDRIDRMAGWGCDYVEFDNMDWCTWGDYRDNYGNIPGQEFPSAAECAEHNIAMCEYAHSKNMLCMAKNTGNNNEPSEYAGGDKMDGVTFESYRKNFNWWDDEHLQVFLDNNKPVVIVHYDARSNENKDSCDYILKKYQETYDSNKISFICESKPKKKYVHFNLQPQAPTPPTPSPPAPSPPTPTPPAPSPPTNMQNSVKNSGFEGPVSSDWSPFLDGYSVSTSNMHSGSQGIKVSNGGARQILDISVNAGKTVTISGWSKAVGVSTDIAGGNYAIYADVKFSDGSSAWGRKATFEGGTHGWHFSEYSFVPEKEVTRILLYALYRNDNGVAYFDDVNVWVEQNSVTAPPPTPPAPTPLKNGGFEGSVLSDWPPLLDGYSVSTMYKHSGTQGIKVTNGGAKQVLNIAAEAGSILTLSGWSKADGVSSNIAGGNYAIYADLKMADGSFIWGRKATFNGGTHDWQFSDYSFVLPKPMARMTIYALYRRDGGTAYFDDVNVSIKRGNNPPTRSPPTPTRSPPTPTPGNWWKPKASDNLTWQWQLQGRIDTSYDVDMYDIDLFDTSAEMIRNLKAQGRIVVCYFSAGTYEGWRPDWKVHFPFITGDSYNGSQPPFANKMAQWDERWLDIRRIDLLGPIMRNRIKLAVEKGCDAVEPDNVDAYINGRETKINLTYADQKRYNLWLANEAHALGMSIGLKNDVDQLKDLAPAFDWALNEQCFQYNECQGYNTYFVKQNKAVFGVEYRGSAQSFCPKAKKLGLSWLKKSLSLGSYRVGCEDVL